MRLLRRVLGILGVAADYADKDSIIIPSGNAPTLEAGRKAGNIFLDSPREAVQYGVMRHDVVRHNDLPRNAEPLTEAVLLILLSLAEQPRHGYSILKDVEEMSAGRVVLSTGTLYGALRRLLGDGWIERFEEDDASRDRHAYRLTVDGRNVLQVEVTRMKQLTRLAALRTTPKEA